MEFLNSFSSEKLKIEDEDSDFNENKIKLQIRADKIIERTAQYSNFEELDILLKGTISKQED